VTSIDHRPVGSGGVGPLTSRISKLYFDVARGREQAFSHWVTPVY
jgi:branched-chain amino acid aminotransferase